MLINNCYTRRDIDTEEVGGRLTRGNRQIKREGMKTIEKAKQTEGELRKWRRQGQRETETSRKRETGWWEGDSSVKTRYKRKGNRNCQERHGLLSTAPAQLSANSQP